MMLANHRDGGRHRACLQAVALNVAESMWCVFLWRSMTAILQDVFSRSTPVGIPIVGRDDLAGDHADHAARAGVLEIIRVSVPTWNVSCARSSRYVSISGPGSRAVSCRPNRACPSEDHLDVEILEVVDDGKVGQIAGRDGAAVVQQEIARRMVARSLDGDDRVDAVFVDGLAQM